MSAPCFGRPIWLVQLSLLEAPAVVRLRTPRSRISHSQSIFFFIFHLSFYPYFSECLKQCLGSAQSEIGSSAYYYSYPNVSRIEKARVRGQVRSAEILPQ
uniref:Uncharacterized protein n=1 Tax=Ammopiptanthus mongolicus TaxID=126911 RepID=A0A4P8PFJ6_AMMMO|nr:hypothetical protein [Ammopiptanthus mongolicus]